MFTFIYFLIMLTAAVAGPFLLRASVKGAGRHRADIAIRAVVGTEVGFAVVVAPFAWCNGISDAGLEYLSLPQLGALSIQKTRVTKAGIDKLRQALPGLTVYGP